LANIPDLIVYEYQNLNNIDTLQMGCPWSPHHCESCQFMKGSCPATLLNIGGSTQMPVNAWNNAWRDTWGLLLPVKLESSHMTYTVPVPSKTQPNFLKNLLRTITQKSFNKCFLLTYRFCFFQRYLQSQRLDRLYPRAVTYLANPRSFSLDLDKTPLDST
jgi:hypothetical protein